MSTQMVQAKNGIISDEVRCVARLEKIDANYLREKVAQGRAVILKNAKKTGIIPKGIGEGLKVKVCADIGLTNKKSSISSELDKIRIMEQAGTDVLVDLTSENCFDEFREEIISTSKIPVGAVPVYQAYKETFDKYKLIDKMSKDSLFSNIEKQCSGGADFIRLHCGVTKFVVEQIEKQKRLTGTISKGGSIMACWVKKTGLENPLYKFYDELLDLVKSYDVVLSLSSGLRAGCIADGLNRAQMAETVVLGELVQRARKEGVQTMVEALGHITADNIPSSIQTIKDITLGAPLFAREVLPCDCAIGYDNITNAIGSSIAACNGANMLSCIPASLYLGSVNLSQIREGIISAKIAAQCADIVKGNKQAIERNVEISKAKMNFDWKNINKNSLDDTIFDGVDISDKNKKSFSFEPYTSMKLYKKYFD